MELLEQFSVWLGASPIGYFAKHYEWVWPLCQILHFVGLVLLVGMVGILDLRMLGVAKGLSARPLNKFVKFGVAGFGLNIVTGVIFYSGDPLQYLHNPAFQWKMAFVALAGLNVLTFYATGMFRKVEALGPGEDAPLGAKIIATMGLLFWFAVMYMGRMLPYLGDAF